MKEKAGAGFWLEHVKAWRGSGERQWDYCERHGLKLSAMRYWCRHRPSRSQGLLDLVPVKVRQPELSAALQLRGPHGWELLLPQGISPEWVATLLKTL